MSATIKSTVVICLIDQNVIEAVEQRSYPGSVVRALKRSKREVARVSGRKPDQWFVTRAALRKFLLKELSPLDRAHIPGVEQVIECRLALRHRIPREDDFTFFLPRTCGSSSRLREHPDDDAVETLLRGPRVRKVFSELLSEGAETYYEGELWLWDGKARRAARGRALACSCFRGKKWSVTFRRQEEYPRQEKTGKFLNKMTYVTQILYRTIFEADDAEKRGLIVIAGRTGSGKSQIARGLIQSYLRDRKSRNSERAPHLLTFEDPIEKEFTKFEIGIADCTQREKPTDSRGLVETVRNALRQTPTIVFAGETRDPQEWTQLLEFAGTGHLVITTTHAGSLVEAMGNILKETDSRTPAARSVVADRLLAVVHIKSGKEQATGASVLIPAIWHRTPIGIKALMAEGLSSLLPNTPPELDSSERNNTHLPGSVGRYWFARELTKKSLYPATSGWVREKAIEWDLEGI